jgi:ABC-2 type transport system ATP-binding protein
MNAIEIEKLNKTYTTASGPIMALEDMNFTIKQGELFGLLGPNGAGKSTIINILAGVVKKTSGDIRVQGTSIDDDHVAVKKMIGIMPQEISIDAFTPIEEALRLEFGYYGQPVDEKYLTKILKDLALEDKREMLPRALSGGMKRRLMIARALMHRPEILVLDEPTAGVDVELRHEMYNLIRKLNESGVTIILTTHYLEEVELLCDRVAIIHKGRLVALDHKEELKNRFQSSRQFSIAMTEKISELPEDLKRFNPSWNDHQLILHFEENEYRDLLKTVAKHDLPIAHFSIIEPSLEDVFVSLTEEK